MTLTSAACPLTDVIEDQTNSAARGPRQRRRGSTGSGCRRGARTRSPTTAASSCARSASTSEGGAGSPGRPARLRGMSDPDVTVTAAGPPGGPRLLGPRPLPRQAQRRADLLRADDAGVRAASGVGLRRVGGGVRRLRRGGAGRRAGQHDRRGGRLRRRRSRSPVCCPSSATAPAARGRSSRSADVSVDRRRAERVRSRSSTGPEPRARVGESSHG